MAKKKKNKSPTAVPFKKSIEKKKFPIWVKLLVAVLAGVFSLRIMSTFQYYQQFPDPSFTGPSMLNPMVLFDFTKPWYLDQKTLVVSFMVFCLAPMMMMVYEDNQKKRRQGIEQGSAQWTDTRCSQDFRDENYFENQIFTQTELFSRNMDISLRNRNILLLGRPGTGKSRFYFKPNLLQRFNGSVIITDPKGELLRDCGYAMRQNGYTIKVLNLDEMWQSNHYNPFSYLKYSNIDTNEVCVNLSEEQIKSRKYKLVDADVLQMIESIMKNTTGENAGGSKDPFWDKAESLYLQSIIYYIVYNYPKEKQNFSSVLDLMRRSESKNGQPSDLDVFFDEWEHGKFVLKDGKKINLKISDRAYRSMVGAVGRMGRETTAPQPSKEELEAKIREEYERDYTEEERKNHIIDSEGFVRMKSWVNEYGIPCQIEGTDNIGIKQWHHLKSGADSEKTMASIMLSAAARLAPINIPEVANFINDDDMELERLGTPEPTPPIPGGKSVGGRIAWFIVTKPSEQAFNFIANLFYTQTFQMIDINAKKSHGSCPTPIDMYMDEWAQLGEIPRFVETLSYVRGLNCGITIGLQSLDQLKKVYKDSWQTALDDCDYLLFLGSTSKDTLDYIVSLLGKETIYKRSQSRSYGRSGSTSHSDDMLARDLMDIQEMRTMGFGKCVLLDMKESRGAGYYSQLYDLKQHPRYNSLYEPKNQSDPENRAREYKHGMYLMEEKREKEFLNFYHRFGLDPEKIKIRMKDRLVDGERIIWTPAIKSPEEFLQEAEA